MYRNRKPSTRRDRRKGSQRARRQHREGLDKTLLITLGIFAVVALVFLVLIAIALQPG